jgi:hypothetical protein
MIHNLIRNFRPNRAWECNSRWQYSPTRFKLNVPLLNTNDNTKYIIELINITEHDIVIQGRLIEEVKPQPNKNIDTEYNGKTGW